MNVTKEFAALMRHIETVPVFSDHEHHQPDALFREPVSLDSLLAQSYVGWLGHTPGNTPESRAAYLDHVRHNTYFVWFEKGFCAAHGVEGPITAENWDELSALARAAHRENPDLHVELLRRAGYERLILDTYWNPGDDNGHPDLFWPAFRIDKFMYGHHPDSADPDGFNPWERYGFTGGSLDDYVEHMRGVIRARHAAGKVAAFKCAEAYRRPVTYAEDDRGAAKAVFGHRPGKISPELARLFGNYIFNRCCELAGELGVPFQIHTGLAQLTGSDPMHLAPVLERHSGVRFVLFHAGYPWVHTVAGLAHNYPNACPSLTWMPTISTSAAVRALQEFLDVAQSARTITWGGDCWTAEESTGALMAWRWVVARTLGERMDAGLLRPRDAEALAVALLRGNNLHVYGQYPAVAG